MQKKFRHRLKDKIDEWGTSEEPSSAPAITAAALFLGGMLTVMNTVHPNTSGFPEKTHVPKPPTPAVAVARPGGNVAPVDPNKATMDAADKKFEDSARAVARAVVQQMATSIERSESGLRTRAGNTVSVFPRHQGAPRNSLTLKPLDSGRTDVYIASNATVGADAPSITVDLLMPTDEAARLSDNLNAGALTATDIKDLFVGTPVISATDVLRGRGDRMYTLEGQGLTFESLGVAADNGITAVTPGNVDATVGAFDKQLLVVERVLQSEYNAANRQ